MFSRRKITAGLIVIVCSFAVSSIAEKPEETSAEAEMVTKSMELSKPGPEHKRLEKLEGTWDQEVRIWMQPDAEPMTFEGRSSNALILGGRFLQIEGVSGEGPMQTEAVIVMGFDRRYERYTAVGFDNWGTYYVAAKGSYVDSANKIVMQGEDYDPVLTNWQHYRFELTYVNPDEYLWETFFTDEAHTKGKTDEFKMVEITCTRAD